MSDWISVDDELPEIADIYLVTGDAIEMEFSSYCVDFGWEDEGYEITHWMPLPEPPK